MDLQQTIDELEKQSSQYAEAAATLRALLADGTKAAAMPEAAPAKRGRPRQTPAVEESGAESSGAESSGAKSNGRKTKKKRTMSPETRAKLSAAATLRHAQRKADAGATS